MTKGITPALMKQVKLDQAYPYSFVENLTDETGKAISGRAWFNEWHIELDINLRPGRLQAVYLHEVGHLIANNKKIDQAPGANVHNQYFAALVAVMYRRAGLLDRMMIYDFADQTHYLNGAPSEDFAFADEGMADGDELVARFRYIIATSARFAPSDLSIEAIASEIFYESVFPAWTGCNRPTGDSRPRRWVSLWPLATGALCGLAGAAVMLFPQL